MLPYVLYKLCIEVMYRKEAKGKGKKERYIHLNAEFQRIQAEIRKPSSVINAKK